MKKKVAVVADIHANKYAIDVFMKYVDANNIDIVLNLGDFVQIGPNPKEVTKIVLNDKRFINILGNNETSLFEIDSDDDSSENQHRKWTRKQLEDDIETIKEIGKEKIININGLEILMIHSRKNDIKGMPVIYQEGINEFVKDYEEFHTKIVLFGHTHERMLVEHSSKFFVNPGSLGCSRQKSADFAIIEIDNDEIINISFKSLHYDINKVIADYHKYDVPDREFILKTFYNTHL